MAIHNYTAGGRTRRPIAPHYGHTSSICNIAGLAEARQVMDSLLTGSTLNWGGNGIYETRNQRYMHIATSGSSTVTKIYAYNFAFASSSWTSSIDTSDAHRGIFTEYLMTGSVSLPIGNDKYVAIDIEGVDAVAFTITGTVYAAFSTF